MTQPTSMSDIENGAKKLAQAREELAALASELQSGIDALTRDAMPQLKRAVAKAQEHQGKLLALVESAPELFVKPKAVIFHGIKTGYQKSRGKLEFSDADAVVRLIHKHFPDQADVLISTVEKPAKDALVNLAASDLKRLGVQVTSDGEMVFVKFTDTVVDKMVASLLTDVAEEAAAA